MPNWVDQQLDVIGPRADIERFCKLAVVSLPKSDPWSWLPEFAFTRVCPVRPDEEQAAEYDPEYGDLFRIVRSRTQVNFSIQTAWTHPVHFYLTRLLRDWPSFSFCCAVNEDMSNFGGLIGGFDGVVTNLVCQYDENYNRRSHGRRIRALNKRWARLAREGRPFMVWLLHRRLRRAHYDVDATFDQGGLELYLRTEAECRRLVRHRRHAVVLRESRRGGSPREVRALCKGDVWKGL